VYINTPRYSKLLLFALYGEPFINILYLTDLAQKLLSLCIFSYLSAEIAVSAQIQLSLRRFSYLCTEILSLRRCSYLCADL